MRKSDYNTKQKDLLLSVIRNNSCEFSVKDIYEKVKDSMGLTTVYRFIDKLVEEGMLNKTIGEDNTTYYQYLEECDCLNHFYLKCTSCGEMIHVDCECIDDLSTHILKHHKFRASREHIIINGTCFKCCKEVN